MVTLLFDAVQHMLLMHQINEGGKVAVFKHNAVKTGGRGMR
jgi:hypothetical protein